MLCTVEDVRARAHAELNTWDETHIEATIAAVCRRIAEETGRQFEAAAEDETHVYEALRDGYVLIDDALTLTEVAFAATEVATPTATTTYRTRRNPSRSIYALDNGPWVESDLVYVTGEFAYGAAVPDDIWDIAVAWTIRTLKEADAAYQDATAIPEMGQLVYRKAVPGDVLRVLSRYTRVTPVLRVG